MAISFVGAATQTFSVTASPTVDIPAGVQDGDLLLFIFTGDTAHNSSGTPPTGVTKIGESDVGIDSTTSVFWKIAASEGSTLTFTSIFDANETGGYAVVAYRGVDETTPIDATSAVGTASSTAWDTGSVTPATDGAWLVAIFGADPGGTYTFAWDGGITERLDSDTTPSGQFGTIGYIAVGDMEVGTAGTPTTLGGDSSTLDNAAAFLIALRPGAGVGAFTLDCQPGSFTVTGAAGTLVAPPRVIYDAPKAMSETVAVNHHAIAVDGRTVHYVYRSGTTIVYRRSIDGGWSFSAGTVISDVSVDEIPLTCPMDARDGTVVLLFKSGNGLRAIRSTDGGANWSASAEVANDGAGRFYRASLGITSNGHVHALWVSIDNTAFTTNGLVYRRSTDSGASWSTAVEPFSSAVNPSRPGLQIDENDVLHLAWGDTRYGTTEAYTGSPGETLYSKSEDDGATWATEIRLTNTTVSTDAGTTLRPELAVGNGSVNVVYQDPGYTAGSEDLYLVRSTDNGESFGSPALIVSAASSQEHPYIRADGDDVVLAWTDNRSGTSQIYEKHSADGGASWSAAQLLYSTGSAQPSSICAINDIFMYVLLYVSGDQGYLLRRSTLPVPPSTVIDDFDRANEGPPPSTEWTDGILTTVAGEGLVVLSNALARKATGGFRQGSYFNTAVGAADQYVGVSVSQAPSSLNDGAGVYARLTNPGLSTITAYALDLEYDGTDLNWQVLRLDDSTTLVTVATGLAQNVAAGDRLVLQCRGSDILCWYYDGADWAVLISTVDSTYSPANGGFAGVELLNNQNLRFDDFVAVPTVEFDAQPGSFAITGTVAGVLAGRVVSADPAAYDLTGAAAAVVADRVLSADPASYVVTGEAATVVPGYAALADPGSFAVTGVAADLVYTPTGAFALDAQPGSYAVSGTAATTVGGFAVDSSPGTYAVTGSDASLVLETPGAFVLDAGTGVFAVTGVNAAPLADRIFSSASGVYAITGDAATLFAEHGINAATGTFSLAGTDAGLLGDRAVNAATGSYLVGGSAANLVRLTAADIVTARFDRPNPGGSAGGTTGAGAFDRPSPGVTIA